MKTALYGLAALLLAGCVQATAATKDQVAPVGQQVVRLQGVEKVLSLNGVKRVTMELINGETPTCQINATFSGVILLGSKLPTCEAALQELIAKTTPKKEAKEEGE